MWSQANHGNQSIDVEYSWLQPLNHVLQSNNNNNNNETTNMNNKSHLHHQVPVYDCAYKAQPPTLIKRLLGLNAPTKSFPAEI
jgi:hypothetical protein